MVNLQWIILPATYLSQTLGHSWDLKGKVVDSNPRYTEIVLFYNFRDCRMLRKMSSVNSRLVIINDHSFSVLIQFKHRVDNGSWNIMKAYSTGQTKSLRLMVPGTPLTGWCHWLVQDSRWRRTIWTFKLFTALFVIMPAPYL